MAKKLPTKEEVKKVIDRVDLRDLPDGAHWQTVHSELGLDYGDVFPIMTANPDFFGLQEVK